MKRVLISALSLALLSVGLTATASAATEAQKLTAILNGLAHLDYVQCKTAGSVMGSWGTSQCGGGESDAFTGAALFALLTQKAKWPANLATQYATDVTNGVNYLLANASVSTVSTNNSSQNICPGGSGTCKAIYWNITNGEEVYVTGFVAAALDTYGVMQGVGSVATTSGPLAGLTWTQIAQGITNAYAAAQCTSGFCIGGWRYSLPSDNDGDMSTTQWGALASGYNESAGATTPAFVKTNLTTWLGNDIATGAACYQPGCGYGPTNSENGAWLVSAAWAGDANQSAATGTLNTQWQATVSNTYFGNFGHPYAMWSTYKGLEATIGLKDTSHITNLLTKCGAPNNLPGSGVCNWWEDYNEYLINGYLPTYPVPTTTDGAGNTYWAGYSYWPDPLSTAVFSSIIGASALPSTITQTPPTTVPAVGRWGLVALGILLVTFAAMKLRKPQTT